MTTSAFDPVRAAVAGYAGHPAPAGSAPAGPPPEAFEPFATAVARVDPVLGQLVARFGAVGYARYLEYLTVECSSAVAVHVYAGAIAPTSRISSYGDGSLADYAPPTGRYVPGGAPVFVVWEAATGTAAATAQFRQA